jgi:hypothetical protein
VDAPQPVWLAPGLLGLVFAILLWTLARARSARVNRSLRMNRTDRMPGAGLLLTLTIFVTACAVGAVVVLIAIAG